MSIRVLVVDDSPFIRRLISDWIKSEPDLELAGTANDGFEAVSRAIELKPDVVTLDVEMPQCDGLSALRQLMSKYPVPVIMVSSITTQGAEATLQALEIGAVDFVTKPQGASSLKVLSAKDELLAKIRAVTGAKLGSREGACRISPPSAVTLPNTDKVVLVASSTGGPSALSKFFHTLPKGFPATMLIVQHMPVGFTKSLAARLDAVGAMPCREAVDGDPILAGHAYLAPGGQHMEVGPHNTLKLTDGAQMHGVRPAADVLFLTAAHAYGARCLGVVLTGMGKDGAQGALAVRKAGGYVFGQDEGTCTIYGMPRAAMEAGAVDSELPLQDIGPGLVSKLSEVLRHAS